MSPGPERKDVRSGSRDGRDDIAVWRELATNDFYCSDVWINHCRSYDGVAVTRRLLHDPVGNPAGIVLSRFLKDVPKNYDWIGKYSAAGVRPPSADACILGAPLGYHGSVLRSASWSPSVDMADGLSAYARDIYGSASVVGMYLSTQDVRILRRCGFDNEPLLLEPEAWIPVPEGGWEGYESLFSSHTRSMVRRERRRFAESGSTVTHEPLEEVWRELPEIAASVALRYDSKDRAVELEREFHLYAENTGDVGIVAMGRRHGQLFGFCLYFPWGDALYLRWACFDHSRLNRAAEYFNVLIYSPLEVAGEGVRWVHAGKAALEAKVGRGAELRPMWALDLTAHQSQRDREQLKSVNRAKTNAYREDKRFSRAMDAAKKDWVHFSD